jgi:hypothetical protein
MMSAVFLKTVGSLLIVSSGFKSHAQRGSYRGVCSLSNAPQHARRVVHIRIGVTFACAKVFIKVLY